jgi:predicted metal-dependent enzyme (double-stranded beta helix superfamily)
MSIQSIIHSMNCIINNNSKYAIMHTYLPLLRKYEVNKDNGIDWKAHIDMNNKSFNRTLLYKHPKNIYDIFLISWSPYFKSEIHDHAHNGCIFKVLDGKLQENIYNANINPIKYNILHSNDCSAISNKINYHQIINQQNKMAYSLHIYSPANYSPNTYSDFSSINQ